MIRSKALRWNEHGDPKLTIEVEGFDDCYRLAHHLERGQVEFADIGLRVKQGLRRKVGRETWERVQRWFHGEVKDA